MRGDAAMSALFGHVKGAFTGRRARSARACCVGANGGVLFLDEIGELGLDEQAMLLRALEEKRFLPLGGDREVTSDFQLIAGTNRELTEAVSDGRFRDDLLARINLWTFRLPGLADRREDIEPNLDYELEQYRRRTGTAVTFSREARAAFLSFATGETALARQLPRPERGRHAPGHARAGGPHHDRAGESRDRPPPGRGHPGRTSVLTVVDDVLSPRVVPGSIGSTACSSRTCCGCAARRQPVRRRPRAVQPLARTEESHERRRSPAKISRTFRPRME